MINRRLIEARKAKRWTQAYLASQLAVSSITVSRWENGIQVPQVYCVHRLCQIFGLTDRELGFAPCQDTTPQEYRMVYEEMDRYFTFGKIKTAEMILDGDGTGVYLPQHIHSHYIPVALELPEEFQARKERIAQEQEERKAQGDSYQWNGERYNLAKFNIGRDPANEDMILGLWFRPSDYYTFMATSRIAQDQRCAKSTLLMPNGTRLFLYLRTRLVCFSRFLPPMGTPSSCREARAWGVGQMCLM